MGRTGGGRVVSVVSFSRKDAHARAVVDERGDVVRVPGRVAREEVGEVEGDAPVRRASVVQDGVVEAAGGDGTTRLGRMGGGGSRRRERPGGFQRVPTPVRIIARFSTK